MIEMYGAKDMHRIALAIAIENGPKLVRVNGENYGAYALTKLELQKIFVMDNGYSADRSAWKKVVCSWGDRNLWADLVAKEFMQDGNWSMNVIFMSLGRDEITRLKMYSEDHHARALYKDADEPLPTYDLSDLIIETVPTTLEAVQ